MFKRPIEMLLSFLKKLVERHLIRNESKFDADTQCVLL